MATTKHPITGVDLNLIAVRRKALDFDEAVTAIILRQQGHHYHAIAHLLGTNPARVGEVFRGESHPEARMTALRKLSRQLALLADPRLA